MLLKSNKVFNLRITVVLNFHFTPLNSISLVTLFCDKHPLTLKQIHAGTTFFSLVRLEKFLIPEVLLTSCYL